MGLKERRRKQVRKIAVNNRFGEGVCLKNIQRLENRVEILKHRKLVGSTKKRDTWKYNPAELDRNIKDTEQVLIMWQQQLDHTRSLL